MSRKIVFSSSSAFKFFTTLDLYLLAINFTIGPLIFGEMRKAKSLTGLIMTQDLATLIEICLFVIMPKIAPSTITSSCLKSLSHTAHSLTLINPKWIKFDAESSA